MCGERSAGVLPDGRLMVSISTTIGFYKQQQTHKYIALTACLASTQYNNNTIYSKYPASHRQYTAQYLVAMFSLPATLYGEVAILQRLAWPLKQIQVDCAQGALFVVNHRLKHV